MGCCVILNDQREVKDLRLRPHTTHHSGLASTPSLRSNPSSMLIGITQRHMAG